jgi:hypothetical protein
MRMVFTQPLTPAAQNRDRTFARPYRTATVREPVQRFLQ